jgi:peptide/nickel transport system substrate-binding protein
VIVRLVAANGDLPIMLGTFHFMIVPAGTTDFTTAVGTGPYSVSEFTPGVRSIGVRNENYFKEGRPYVDEIEFFGISDDSARINALYSGDVDMISSIKATAAKEVDARDGVEVMRTPAPRFSQLVMMADRSPTDNLDLRLCIKHLVDRERLLNTVAQGYGQLGNDHMIAPSSPLYNADIPQHMLDRDKAKYYLKKAGMENSTLELHVSGAAANSVETGQFLQREAAQIGLNIQLKREPKDGYWSNIWLKRGFYGGEWNARPTYDMLLSLGWTSDAKWNESQIKDPRLDSLIAEGRITVDAPKRKEIYGEIQRIIHDEGGNVIPMFIDYLDAKSSKVQGITAVPTGGFGGFNFADTVWLQS